MSNLCIPKPMRDDIVYLLQENQEEHNHMTSELWHEAHERLIGNSGLDIEKWQAAQRIEFTEHQLAVEFIYSIPVCGEATKGISKIAMMESLLDTLTDICEAPSTGVVADKLLSQGIKSWDAFETKVAAGASLK